MKDMRSVKPGGKRLISIFFAIILVVLIIGFTGRYFLVSKIQHALHTRIEALQKQGIHITFDSLSVSPWSNTIHVKNFRFIIGPDTSHYQVNTHTASLTVSGIRILPFILHRSLEIRSVQLVKPSLKYRHSSRRTNFRENDKALEGILIDRIQIDNMTLLLQDSTGKDTTSIVKGLFDIQDVAFYKRNDSLKWLDADIKINDLTMQSPHGLYQYVVKSASLNIGDQALRIDSVKINPVYNKQAFMRAAGFETDRIDGLISHLQINGLEFMDYPKSIKASTVETRYRLKIFHDKRYPSRRPPVVKTLPAHFIQRLPFALSCDTINIKDSYLSYEEFPIKGDSSGFIVFSHLNATLTGVHNNPSRHSDVIMNISAKFMDQGDLTATFTFPYDTTKSYSTTGTLRNFVLKNANPMLVPAARARIESGLLTSLKFHFLYNNYESDGELELNYQDLKISSLHQNKDHEPAINHIKTFLLNALIIKKNRNEDTNSEKRKGTIQYHRDPHKAIFNYWWKSILSGIKSAYKLDKIPGFAKKDQKKK